MANRPALAPDEWYHCYNRGVDKRVVFIDEADYERMLLLLYICNDSNSSVRIDDLGATQPRLSEIVGRSGARIPLVDIAAYSLMPNHIHLILRQPADSNLSRYIQKVFTGYTMYFNKKYHRTGALFAGSYKSKHLDTDEYFKQAIAYVQLNPVELLEPKWKQGYGDIASIEQYLRAYKYASTKDFFGALRAENEIVSDIAKYFDRRPTLRQLVRDAQEYYREIERVL